LIEGNYPKLPPVIPSEAKERINLSAQTFLIALRRVSMLASDKKSAFGQTKVRQDEHIEQYRYHTGGGDAKTQSP